MPSAALADLADDRISEGLTAVVSVKLQHPDFAGATHAVLGNAAVRACVREAVLENIGRWLKEHPQQAADITGRIMRDIGRD